MNDLELVKKSTLFEYIQKDLRELYDKKDLVEAKRLNDIFFSNNGDAIARQKEPMYFAGKIDAPTVFVMLNPGGSNKITKEAYTKLMSEINKFSFEEFVDTYICEKLDYKRDGIDNFDLKQAAFLYDFKDNGIDIPDFFINKDEKFRKTAQKNVIDQKLQLELIPYESPQFKYKAKLYAETFKPYLERILDTIIEFDRKLVIFGSRKFYDLFVEYKKSEQLDIEFETKNEKRSIDNLAFKVSWSIVNIKYKNKVIRGLIANTFPNQALPNAYNQMREYGKLCYESYKKATAV